MRKTQAIPGWSLLLQKVLLTQVGARGALSCVFLFHLKYNKFTRFSSNNIPIGEEMESQLSRFAKKLR
jgi:hypothetical protein